MDMESLLDIIGKQSSSPVSSLLVAMTPGAEKSLGTPYR